MPAEARSVAYLHDILEHSDASVADLEAAGVTPVELQAVQLLTCHPDESFEAHALRIAYAKGSAGRLARMVKLADIDDHLSRGGRQCFAAALCLGPLPRRQPRALRQSAGALPSAA